MKGWRHPVTEQERAAILRLHHAEGWPVGTISAELGRHHVAGLRIEATVSSPTASAEKLAASAAAEPPDEPPTVRSRLYGFRVAPNSPL